MHLASESYCALSELTKVRYKNVRFSTGLGKIQGKQGRIHGNAVADGWAGAVLRKPLEIQKCDGRTDGRTEGPTDRPTRVRD